MSGQEDARAARAALVQEAISWAAHGILYGFGYIPSRHRPERARDIRTLVFVHGLGANRASFFPMQGFLRLLGHQRQYSFNYPTRGSIEAMALHLARRLARDVRGGRIDLVCHSLGGLVARYYLQELGGDRRVDRLITLGTPHHGTLAAVYLPTAVVSQLWPESAFLRRLNRLPAPRGVRAVSFAAGRDILILPRESALAPFGATGTFPELGHLDMLLSPRVFVAVHAALAEPSEGRAAARA
jgi:pimeloyl-ACP methyl ester carboxylesterase